MNLISLLQLFARGRIQRATRMTLYHQSNQKPQNTSLGAGPRNLEIVSLGITADGKHLVVSLDALCSHGLILGATGSGKTYAANVIIEAMLRKWGKRKQQ